MVLIGFMVSGSVFSQKKNDSIPLKKMPKIDSIFDVSKLKLKANSKLSNNRKAFFSIPNAKPDTSLYKMPNRKVNSNGLLALKSNTDLSKAEKVLPKIEKLPRITPKVEK